MSLEPAVEAHQQNEVDENLRAVRAVADRIASEMGVTVTATVVPDDAEVPPGCKKVHFIRHGEGHHNVVQREWRARAGWDGASEPYTLDTDPEYRFVDALLTEKGEAEARALQARTRRFTPQLLVVSPLRRATQTGLLAFEPSLPPSPSHGGAAIPVVAHELCHERAGRHTCDKRLDRTALAAAYPLVNYEQLDPAKAHRLVASEGDPYWGDGLTREPWEALARWEGARVGARARARASLGRPSHGARPHRSPGLGPGPNPHRSPKPSPHPSPGPNPRPNPSQAGCRLRTMAPRHAGASHRGGWG